MRFEIHDLTKEDVQILDTIWALDTQEELDSYMNSISTEKRKRVNVLIELIRLSEIDSKVESMDDYPQAAELLKKILH